MTNLNSILKSRDIKKPIKFPIVKAMLFQESCMDAKELMLLNCGVGEDS